MTAKKELKDITIKILLCTKHERFSKTELNGNSIKYYSIYTPKIKYIRFINLSTFQL